MEVATEPTSMLFALRCFLNLLALDDESAPH